MAEQVLYETDGRVATITLNRPDTMNALGEEVVPALVDALNRAEADEGISCIVLTGAGRAFCAGGNIREIRAMTAEKNMSAEEIADWYRTGIQRIPKAVEALSVPVVAAVNGHAIGAGLDLAAMCDIRIAGKSAQFAESFLRVGLIPGDGGAWFLPRAIGFDRANHMLLTGEFISAETAHDYGLVAEVASDETLLARAQEIANRIASFPPQAVRLARRHMREAQALPLGEALDKAADMQGALQQYDDHREAISAILEKRKPVFTGQ